MKHHIPKELSVRQLRASTVRSYPPGTGRASESREERYIWRPLRLDRSLRTVIAARAAVTSTVEMINSGNGTELKKDKAPRNWAYRYHFAPHTQIAER
eukprot:3647664-Pleurochrysis_carterae.AAC.1